MSANDDRVIRERHRRWKPPIYGRDGMTVGQRMKLAREQRGIKAIDVSRRFKVWAEQLSHWEGDYKMPNLVIFAELARYYGVSVDEMYWGPLP